MTDENVSMVEGDSKAFEKNAKSLPNLHTSITGASKIGAIFSTMEMEMEGIAFEELSVKGEKPMSVWVGYWMLQAIIEVVLAFGVFVVMLIVILGFDIDAWHFVRPDQVSGWGLYQRLALYEILSIAFPWLVYGCFQTERKRRLFFLLRWGMPMSMVILVAMTLMGAE